MERQESKSGGSRRPWGFLGMVVLVLSVETTLARHRFDFLDPVGVSWALSERAAGGEPGRSSVLCFGDSLLKFGFRPGMIEARSGQSAYNLAVIAGRAPTSFFLLRRALDAGARPSAVVVDFEPNILAQSPLIAHDLWAELITPHDCWELAWEGRDAGFLARTLTSRFLPSARYKSQIRSAILTALSGQPIARGQNLDSLIRDGRQFAGSLAMPHAERAEVAADPRNLAFFPPDWRCDPVNRRYVQKFFALASAHKIPVYWVIPPYAPPIQAFREVLGQDARFSHFVRATRSKHPEVTVLDGRKSRYHHSTFWDNSVHLDEQGATTLSADVADVLARSFAGNQPSDWVSLPAYRPLPPENAPISGIAIGNPGSRSR